MNNKLLVKVLIGVIILILLGVVAKFTVFQPEEEFSVVYTTTGEVYVGKLTMFPRPTLRDGYLFQTGLDSEDPDKVESQLIPLTEAAWAPSLLYLNRDQIVFFGPVLDTSLIADAIKTRN